MPKLLPREEEKRDKAFASLVGGKMYGNNDLTFVKIAKPCVGCHPITLGQWAKEISKAPTGKMIKLAKTLGLTKEEVINAIW
jgi:hypothetical protein